MSIKKERNLKVYGYEDKWNDSYPAEIRLKGKWLKELGFTVNTPITVVCEEGKLVITRIDIDIEGSILEGIMEYLTTTQIAEKWNISRRRVAKLCAEGRIDGAKLMGKTWWVPEDSEKPSDMRHNKAKEAIHLAGSGLSR